MKSFFKYSALFVCLLVVSAAAAQDFAAGSPFTVRVKSEFRAYSDKDHVYVDAVVTNSSRKTEKFYRFETPYTTFQPILYDMSGREAETKVAYRLDNHTADEMVRGTTPRIISLAPGESFSVRLNLADYYDIREGEKYRVRLLFLPDASKKEAQATANIYRFEVNSTVYSAAPMNMQAEDEGAAGIRPSEVVHLLFAAEKKESWNDYLKYIDEEEYIFSFPEYARKYVGAPDAVQMQVLQEFKTYLIRYRPDELLDYEVLDETVAQNQAKVRVRASRQAARQPFVYVYTFSLEKYRAYWKITGVEASLSRDTRR